MMDKALAIRTALIPQLPLELGVIEFCYQVAVVGPVSMDETVSSSLPVDVQQASPVAALTDDIKKLSDHWSTLLQDLKSANHSLSAFLRVGHPIKVDGTIVTIGFE